MLLKTHSLQAGLVEVSVFVLAHLHRGLTELAPSEPHYLRMRLRSLCGPTQGRSACCQAPTKPIVLARCRTAYDMPGQQLQPAGQ
ncbi:hypothetical protein HYQ44_011660 [Verticillium longisporum]|nr:hypothetical protein HYQ44_011660 [Verticillium longisporum]